MLPLPLLPRRLRYTAVAVVAAFIFYTSLVTVPETVVDDAQPQFLELNHWRHLVAYFTFACSLAYATDHWDLPRFKHAALVIAIAASYGIAMEAGQAFLPHRSPFLISDTFVNTVGASTVLFWYLVRPYLELRPITDYLGSDS